MAMPRGKGSGAGSVSLRIEEDAHEGYEDDVESLVVLPGQVAACMHDTQPAGSHTPARGRQGPRLGSAVALGATHSN
jgi:hypothetical protein